MKALALCVGLLGLFATASGSAATGTLGFYFDPAWSPDGKSIAFVDNGNPQGYGTSGGDLYVMNADGSDLRRLTNSAGAGNVRSARRPSWSPDSKKIAFSYGPNGIYGSEGIFVINANGTRLHKIVDGGSYPAWSPGGRKIAFAVGYEPELLKIYVVNPDGTQRRLVAADKGDVACSLVSPTWSPDGQRMAFGDAGAECRNRIGLVTEYGGRVRTLAQGQVGADPDWSPGGRRIVYSAWDTTSGIGRKIAVLDLKTGRLTALHAGSHPSWSPNSRRIVFSDRGSIFVMSADGTEVSKLFPR